MLRKFLITVTAVAGFVSTKAQTDSTAMDVKAGEETVVIEEDKPTTTVTGSVDAYYKYDFGQSKANNYTSFTNAFNSFELGMASVKIEHKRGKVAMVADLGFGKRAQEFAYNDEGVMAGIKQLYVSYAPAEWVKFTLGSWATHVGYEVLDPYLNRNYSMSYMFTNGPFSHTGLKADFTAGKHGFMVGISNPTDYRTSPDEGLNKKHLLAQYSVGLSENTKVYLNYVGGQAPDSSKGSQFDLVLTSKVSDKFNIGFNGTVASIKVKESNKFSSAKSWWGSALYLNVDPSSLFGLTLRGEYFSDKNQFKVYSSQLEGGTVFATTLSANFRIHGLTIIPEFRLDNASKDIFVKENGSATSSAANFLLAAVYAF